MISTIDKSYTVDFSDNPLLSDDEKIALQRIQEIYRPVERAIFLTEYRIEGKISDDDYENLTGIPYDFNN